MLKIFKIMTARNTCFRIGGNLDSAEASPTATDIEFLAGDDVSSSSYIVIFSNGVEVEVRDVVESWRELDLSF